MSWENFLICAGNNTYTYVVQAVEEKIKGSGGNFVMQMAPKAIQTLYVIDANDDLM